MHYVFKKAALALSCILLVMAVAAQPKAWHHLRFDSLATRWDDGMPLGNGWLGALVWQKEGQLRLSLDRVDLWDDRPMPEIDKLRFSWVVEKTLQQQYDSVQRMGDDPYEQFPAPTKIPGAALEFNIRPLGRVVSNTLDISNGLNQIRFANGAIMHNYVHASEQAGYFSFEQIPDSIIPLLVAPSYASGQSGSSGNSVDGQSLERLGYPQGTITRTGQQIRYHQPTWNGGYYEVLVQWAYAGSRRILGQWTISNNQPAKLTPLNIGAAEPTGWPAHVQWWQQYWSRSSLSIPDSLLERQYYLEMYKFGCVARNNTPPISLQAVWTADNGKLPPWKGDFHHDLNTQLSYWPGYTANHLDLTAGYTNWLWQVKAENERWTRQYFGLPGLNVPGVTTISGKAMGGWIQYSMSPTTAAWIAQHFYWQWRYSMDSNFLRQQALPWLSAAAQFLDTLSGPTGQTRKIPLSSSPEIHDNSIRAWFTQWTNYDLALTRALFNMTGSLYSAKNDPGTAHYWQQAQSQLPALDTHETGLTIAPGHPFTESHRHLSPYMAIYPLKQLNPQDSTQYQIIRRSLQQMEQLGTRQWTGYSFSWAACLYAYARMADSARNMLTKFASNFCATNSFHLNGDQKGGQYSSFTYRPFTLEGNFAFAQGIHEMLLQSHAGYIDIFPATPQDWQNLSFRNLRAEGAYLVSAQKENGIISSVTVEAETDGILQLKLPFKHWTASGVSQKDITVQDGLLIVPMKKGQQLQLRPNIK